MLRSRPVFLNLFKLAAPLVSYIRVWRHPWSAILGFGGTPWSAILGFGGTLGQLYWGLAAPLEAKIGL